MTFHKKGFELQNEVGNNSATGVKRIIILGLCLLECFIFGGTVFGWNVLVFTLKADGIYKDACNIIEAANATSKQFYISRLEETKVTTTMMTIGIDNDIVCDARSGHFSLAFTIATVLMGWTAVPLGWLFDKTGLMFTRLFASLIAVPGFLMLALVTPQTSILIYPAASLIALTAFITMVNCYHVANLAGPKTSTVLALYSGAVSTSGMVFLFVKLAYDSGIERRTCLLFVTCLWAMVIFTTIFLLPRYKVGQQTLASSPPTIYDTVYGSYTNIGESFANIAHLDDGDSSHNSKDSLNIPSIASSVENILPPSPSGACDGEAPPFKESLLSLAFLSHLYYFSINHLRTLYFIGTFSQWAHQVTGSDNAKVSQLTDIFGYANTATFIVAPIVGMIIDRKKKYLRAFNIKGVYIGFADFVPICIACALQAIFSVCVMLGDKWHWMAYVSICLSHITRGFFYASAFNFIGLTFPGQHFGKLLGLTYLVGGTTNFLQYPLLSWANGTGSQLQPNVALLVMVVSTLVHPISLLWRHRKYLQMHKKGKQPN